MGNEISHKRYGCREPAEFERPATEQKPPAADSPAAPTAPGTMLWGSVDHPPKEESQDAATGMKSKEVGRESETASSSLPVSREMVRSTEPQEPSEGQPSAGQAEEAATKPTTVNPDRQICAPAQGRRPATAQQAEGETGVATTDLPPQAATEAGAGDAEDVVTDQGTVESSSAVREGPSDKLCKPSPLCRWLKKVMSPADKAKVKANAITSQK